MFRYLLSGWEGSISDSQLFYNALGSGLHIPEGKYWVADAGFPSCDKLLVPYRGVQYHLREWAQGQQRYVSCILTQLALIVV